MDAQERKALVRQYRDGHRAVVEALRGLKDDELDRSASNEWTPRTIVHHLADSEMTSAIRLRRLIAEDDPLIQGYDEAQFASRLTTDRPIEPSLEAMRWARESTAQILERLTADRPIEPSLEAMRWARETCGQLLERMTEADWNIAGRHTESGRYTTEDWLRIYAGHAHEHAAQIQRSRGRS